MRYRSDIAASGVGNSGMSRRFMEWLNVKWRPEFVQLRTYANGAGRLWFEVETLGAAWQLIEEDAGLSPVVAEQLKKSVSMAFVEFRGTTTQTRTIMGLNAFGFGVFLFMLVILGILAAAIFEQTLATWVPYGIVNDQPLLTRLADAATARGLITFVFTIGVIALALIIVTANVTSQDGDGVRYERSKEILTSMIAILGTILGFYFGKADSQPGPLPDAGAQTASASGPVAPTIVEAAQAGAASAD